MKHEYQKCLAYWKYEYISLRLWVYILYVGLRTSDCCSRLTKHVVVPRTLVSRHARGTAHVLGDCRRFSMDEPLEKFTAPGEAEKCVKIFTRGVVLAELQQDVQQGKVDVGEGIPDETDAVVVGVFVSLRL